MAVRDTSRQGEPAAGARGLPAALRPVGGRRRPLCALPEAARCFWHCAWGPVAHGQPLLQKECTPNLTATGSAPLHCDVCQRGRRRAGLLCHGRQVRGHPGLHLVRHRLQPPPGARLLLLCERGRRRAEGGGGMPDSWRPPPGRWSRPAAGARVPTRRTGRQAGQAARSACPGWQAHIQPRLWPSACPPPRPRPPRRAGHDAVRVCPASHRRPRSAVSPGSPSRGALATRLELPYSMQLCCTRGRLVLPRNSRPACTGIRCGRVFTTSKSRVHHQQVACSLPAWHVALPVAGWTWAPCTAPSRRAACVPSRTRSAPTCAARAGAPRSVEWAGEENIKVSRRLLAPHPPPRAPLPASSAGLIYAQRRQLSPASPCTLHAWPSGPAGSSASLIKPCQLILPLPTPRLPPCRRLAQLLGLLAGRWFTLQRLEAAGVIRDV